MLIKTSVGTAGQAPADREEGSVSRIVRSYSVALTGRSRPTQGAGFVWRHDGIIITTAHAAKDSRVSVRLYDNRVVEGRVVARDRLSDLAMVVTHARGLLIAPVGDPWALRTGSIVLAIEHSREPAGQLSLGLVHGVTRDDDKDPLWLATDMRLALRDMGSPLVDTSARVLGVNSATVNGLTAAIPSNVIVEFVREVEDEGLIPKRASLAA
ncbi:MAG: S1C family serine protease [Gemmatimonadaceae bacterium]